MASPPSIRSRWSSPTSTWPRTSSSAMPTAAPSCAGARCTRMPSDILAKLDVKLDVRQPARGPDAGGPAGGRDRQGHLAGRARADHGRADGVALGARGRANCSASSTPCAARVSPILFIGHRLEEVFQIADRITVLRDGRWISSAPRGRGDAPSRSSATWSGRQIDDFFAKTDDATRGDLLMSVRDLVKEVVFSDINFDVYQGEVLGFAGLVGARRTDVGLALFGIEPGRRGRDRLRRHRASRSIRPSRRCNWASPTSPRIAASWA